jgi:hypothetical protein
MNYAAMKIYKKQGDQSNFKTSQELYMEGLASLLGDTSVNRRKAVKLHSSIMGQEEGADYRNENFGNLSDYALNE